MFLPQNYKGQKALNYLELFLDVLISSSAFIYALLSGLYTSQQLEANYEIKKLSISPWNSEWKIDLTDYQFNKFRSNIPVLLLISFFFLTIRHIVSIYKPDYHNRIKFYLAFSLLFLIYLHNLDVIILICSICFNFYLCKFLASYKWFPVFIWLLNFALLMYSKTSYCIQGPFPSLYSWNGVYNMTTLKILSYCLDYYWFVQKAPSISQQEHLSKCNDCQKYRPCLKFRVQSHSDDYSLISFIAYVIYFPLYVAGPIMTYNSWISQVKLRSSLIKPLEIFIYFLRLLFVFFLMEVLIHLSYYWALIKEPENLWLWGILSSTDMIFASYCILNFIWLKFTIIWRSFRLMTMIDGIECPENMGKCMTNNYCFIGFWRNWHCSFNLWLVRYLYVPTGGNKYKIFNIWIVFGFVALWHDLSWDLLAWGWGMCLFIVPEVLISTFFSQKKFDGFRKTLKYSWLCSLGGGIDCLFIAAANLVGFSFGLKGLEKIINNMDLLSLTTIVIIFILHTNAVRLIESARKVKPKVIKN